MEPGAGASDDENASGWKDRFKALGPGLVTGSSDNDPSGVATYAQAGAQYGFGMVWTSVLTLPMTIVVQEMCDRTATATGEGLGRLVRRRFGHRGRIVIGVLLVLLLVANGVNIAADLMAVGDGMHLLGAGPAKLWAPIAGLALMLLLVVGSYRVLSKVLVWLCLVLFAYVVALFLARVPWAEVWAGLTLRRLSPGLGFWGLVAGVLGTSVSPYLFFWESGQRIEEMRRANGDARAASDADLPPHKAQRRRTQQRFDVVTGMVTSALVMFAIIVATGATLGRHHTTVTTAADAARALQPLAGSWASVIFALGFIGTGLLAVPVLAASASIGISALTDKTWGFDRSPRRAPGFYGLLLLGLVGGAVLSLLTGNVMRLLVLSAMVNAVVAAPFLVVVLMIAGNRSIMGEHANGWASRIVGWVTAAFMGVAGVLAIWSQLAG